MGQFLRKGLAQHGRKHADMSAAGYKAEKQELVGK
jgi:hypothetical protein